VRLTAAFVAHELRTQRRSLRFRLAAAAYLALCTLPALWVYLQAKTADTLYGAATYAAEVLTVQPLATVLLATLLALDGILRERQDGVWTVIGLAPVSNSGYLVRRWLALLALLLPLTMLPLAAAAALATASGMPPAALGPFAGPWLFHILPIALAASAFALAAGTILDHTVAAGIAVYLAILLLPGLANQILAHAGRHVTPPVAWLGADELSRRYAYFKAAQKAGDTGYRFILPATEGGYDAPAGAEILTPAAALPLGAALAALGWAAPFLRRARPDLKPWRDRPGHPFRASLKLANRLRQRYARDPVPAPADRALALAAAVLLLAAGAIFFLRDRHYRTRAAARYAAESAGWPAATPAAVLPERWRLSGEIGAGGDVRTTAEGAATNTGRTATGHLAFSLNEALALRALTVDRGRAAWERRSDRLSVTLTPPLRPGESRRLRFDLAGIPTLTFFNLAGQRGDSFAQRYRITATRRMSFDLPDISSSWSLRLAGPRRIELAASDLLPVPRFTSWRLTPPPQTEDARGLEVPDEQQAPPVDLDFSLRAPAGVLLAESCGQATPPGTRLLSGRCRLPLGDWAVRGGRLVEVSATGLRFAALPQHRERARFHAPTLADLPRQIEAAWPGLRIPPPAVVEWSPPFGPDPLSGMGAWTIWAWDQGPQPEAVGAILLLPEKLVIGSQRIPSAGLAADAVASVLASRRPIERAQQHAFRAVIRALALRRLGLGPASGANLSTQRWMRPMLETSILEAGPYDESYAALRTAALVADLEHRVGPPAVQRGVEAFLGRRGGPPGTLAELTAAISREAGVNLDRYYREDLAGDALPQLTLRNVRAERIAGGGGWRIHGQVANLGSGEASCPVVVITERGSIATDLRVPAKGESQLLVTSPLSPRAVQLDPDRVCFRFENLGEQVTRVDLESQGGR
jgi:ABC-type transport system involved in multi-copper enzyme maturation permease subunit